LAADTDTEDPEVSKLLLLLLLCRDSVVTWLLYVQ
jgi:hypothetical protein